jgi:hypothetical protein
MNSLTQKRAIYSISLTGFALTSIGCGDPIIADLKTVTVADLAIPTEVTYVDPATNITYVYSYDAGDITIGEDLKTVLNVSYVATATDAAGVELQRYEENYVLNGVVTPVEVGAKYTIKFIDQADVTNIFDLTCTLTDLDLDCVDQDATVWAFQIK